MNGHQSPGLALYRVTLDVAVIRGDKYGDLSINRHTYKMARCYNTMRCLRLKHYLIYEEKKKKVEMKKL